METSFFALLKRELHYLFRDPWLLSLVSWIPLLLFVVMWWIFSQGIAKDIPMGVVDLDKSTVSRALIRHYNASPSLGFNGSFLNVGEAVSALRSGTIYGLVVLPVDLEKKTIQGRPAQVTVFVNNQFLLIGKIASSALLQAHGTYTTKVEVIQNMASAGPVIDMALSSAMPVGSQVTPLFNLNKDYAQFLVSAILPAVWQILMVAATVLFFAAEERRGGFINWLAKAPATALLAKMLMLSLLFWLHGVTYLTTLYVWLGWPMHGNWPLLVAAQYLTCLASIGAGGLFFFFTRDAARGLSLAAAYAAPGLAYMGVTFPVTDMTLPARIWRSLLPISHYIEIQFGQVNYGAPLYTALPQLQGLALFFLPLMLLFVTAFRIAEKNSGLSTPVEKVT